MKKILYYLFSLIIIFPLIVYADTCKSDTLTKLKKLGEKVELTYTPKIEEKKLEDGSIWPSVTYTVTVNNLNPDLKVLIIKDYLKMDYYEFKYNNTLSSSLDGFNDGDSVTVTIKAYTEDDCAGKTVATKTIKLPYYNYNLYGYKNFCENHPDFKYCIEYSDKEITSNEFQKELANYISNLNKEEKKEEEPKNNKLFLYIGIGTGILIFISVISILVIRYKKKTSL